MQAHSCEAVRAFLSNLIFCRPAHTYVRRLSDYENMLRSFQKLDIDFCQDLEISAQRNETSFDFHVLFQTVQRNVRRVEVQPQAMGTNDR
jgi:hypothetical protein